MKLLITASVFISAACLLFLFGWQAPVNPAEGPYQFSKEIPIGAGVDANSYDSESGFVFASCGDGTLTVVRVDEAGKLSVVQTVSTPLRSRTMTLDPKTHKLYLSAAKFETPAPAPELKPGEKRPRPKMEPGSFKVVVYEMK